MVLKKEKLSFLWRFANKYTLTILIFIVWMLFFDRNSFLENHQIVNEIEQLEREKDYYQKEIDENNRKIKELESNPENLEKFAREQYLMKKANEDIFIIVE